MCHLYTQIFKCPHYWELSVRLFYLGNRFANFRLNFMFGNGKLLAKYSLVCIVEYKVYFVERWNRFSSILSETAYNTANLSTNKIVHMLYLNVQLLSESFFGVIKACL